jgi:uncharacterized protein (DUF1778 family)
VEWTRFDGQFDLPLTDDERQLDSAAATAVGETLSDFFRRAVLSRTQGFLRTSNGLR